jgi:hypothetical protein
MSAEAWSAFATGAAAFAALGIALWQHWTQQKALAGQQREKAACIAITEWDATSVTIMNYGSTPFLRVRVDEAQANMQQGSGPAWEVPVIGRASASARPSTAEVLGPQKTIKFDFIDWVDTNGAPLSQDQVTSLQPPDVTWRYRDAFGTRWERVGNDRPEPTGGGTPLPGAIDSRERCTYWWRRYQVWKRQVQHRRDERLRRQGRRS